MGEGPATASRFLIIPYTLETNDMRFATPQGFNSGDQFFTYLKDAFDTLYEEGKAGSPKMMSVGLHCRLVGRPGRAAALKRFIEYVLKHDKVWIPRRIEIAEHWHKHHKPEATLMISRDGFRHRASAASSSIRPSLPSGPMTTATWRCR